MADIDATFTASPDEFFQRAQEFYEKKLKNKLEKEHLGKFVAIEVDSGEYFLGDTLQEALENAKKKYPLKIFHSVKIGSLGVFTSSSITGKNGDKWFCWK